MPTWSRLVCRYIIISLLMLLLAGFIVTLPAGATRAAGGDLELAGPGLREGGLVVTKEQLLGQKPLILPDGTEVKQYDDWYSAINTYPTKTFYRGQGIRLRDLLAAAGGLTEDATMIKFIAADGMQVTFTIQELLDEPAFRFPNFMAGSLAGHIPGDPGQKVAVEPLIAHRSFSAHSLAEIRADQNFNSTDAYHLLFGQRAVTHQNNSRFAKYVTKIEVLTDAVPRWDPPQAAPLPGEVVPGTLVELSGPSSDEDKVHYTLDGSDPTIDSPMYNYIARRWWSARARDLAFINCPIQITDDTTIKAVTIGPGKSDSAIATFNYRISAPNKEPDAPATTIVLTVGQKKAVVDDQSLVLEAAPYLKSGLGRTLVPIRFIGEAFRADVDWDSGSRTVSIKLKDKEIVLRLDSDQAYINGTAQVIDCPPKLHSSGRTFVPLRLISELLGAKVSYEAATSKIIMTK